MELFWKIAYSCLKLYNLSTMSNERNILLTLDCDRPRIPGVFRTLENLGIITMDRKPVFFDGYVCIPIKEVNIGAFATLGEENGMFNGIGAALWLRQMVDVVAIMHDGTQLIFSLWEQYYELHKFNPVDGSYDKMESRYNLTYDGKPFCMSLLGTMGFDIGEGLQAYTITELYLYVPLDVELSPLEPGGIIPFPQMDTS